MNVLNYLIPDPSTIKVGDDITQSGNIVSKCIISEIKYIYFFQPSTIKAVRSLQVIDYKRTVLTNNRLFIWASEIDIIFKRDGHRPMWVILIQLTMIVENGIISSGYYTDKVFMWENGTEKFDFDKINVSWTDDEKFFQDPLDELIFLTEVEAK